MFLLTSLLAFLTNLVHTRIAKKTGFLLPCFICNTCTEVNVLKAFMLVKF